ncbi:MAG: hypothetical protein WCL08_06080 [Verrucomicrobiota bacterium]
MLNLLTICQQSADGKTPFIDAFNRVLSTPSTPAKTGYWLGKIRTKCLSEIKEFEEVKNKLVIAHGVPVEGQEGQYTVPAEKLEEFYKELASLDHEVDFGLPAELKLPLPANFTPVDWVPLMSSLDIFEEPK